LATRPQLSAKGNQVNQYFQVTPPARAMQKQPWQQRNASFQRRQTDMVKWGFCNASDAVSWVAFYSLEVADGSAKGGAEATSSRGAQ
jgi:hypothetical protein